MKLFWVLWIRVWVYMFCFIHMYVGRHDRDVTSKYCYWAGWKTIHHWAGAFCPPHFMNLAGNCFPCFAMSGPEDNYFACRFIFFFCHKHAFRCIATFTIRSGFWWRVCMYVCACSISKWLDFLLYNFWPVFFYLPWARRWPVGWCMFFIVSGMECASVFMRWKKLILISFYLFFDICVSALLLALCGMAWFVWQQHVRKWSEASKFLR